MRIFECVKIRIYRFPYFHIFVYVEMRTTNRQGRGLLSSIARLRNRGGIAAAPCRLRGLRWRESLLGNGVILCVQLDADIGAAQHLRCLQRRAGTGERVKHNALLGAKRVHERKQDGQGLLRRVQLVAAIRPVDNVPYGVFRLLRPALGKQIGALVLGAEKPGA
jgi:hypothetical protein